MFIYYLDVEGKRDDSLDCSSGYVSNRVHYGTAYRKARRVPQLQTGSVNLRPIDYREEREFKYHVDVD